MLEISLVPHVEFGNRTWTFFQVLNIGHRQKQNLDPVLIVVTSKQGLPKLARLAQIYPPPSFSHHQAITTTIRLYSLQLGEVSHVFLFREEDQGRSHFICSNWEHFTSSTLGIIHLVITQGGLGYLVGLFLSKGWRGSKITVFGVITKWMPLILHKQ